MPPVHPGNGAAMITEKHQLSLAAGLVLPEEVTDKTLFFDIETTGFSPQTTHLYMIGCCRIKNNIIETVQWFDDTKTPDGEILLLDAFAQFAKAFDTCISFNGATFDFPYIRKKSSRHHRPDPLAHLAHLDIYKKLRPYKNLFQLPDLKQKSLEAFLGICRDDTYSGGQLISVYDNYIRTKSDSLLKLLMLHNYDDICGMTGLLPILAYFKAFEGHIRFKAVEEHAALTLVFELEDFIQIPLEISNDLCHLSISAYELRLTPHPYTGILKYFYDHPGDYYYLPAEDTAIHKSVAAFVDSAYRTRATKENCYTKKEGQFLPQPECLFAPDYKASAHSAVHYFEYAAIRDNAEKLHSYGLCLLQYCLKHA